MRLDLAAAQVVDRLRTAGIAADVDPRNLDPPAVWVQLAQVDTPRKFKAGHYAATWNLTCIAPDAGTTDALRALGELSDTLAATFGTVTGGTALGIILPSGPDPLPGLQWQVALICSDDTPKKGP